MPQNGYWIECIPVCTGSTEPAENAGPLYHASIAAIPEAGVTAKTPDTAIQELRDKLLTLRHDYCQRGKDLPAHDNPVQPPRNLRSTKGWISVYVKMVDCCKVI